MMRMPSGPTGAATERPITRALKNELKTRFGEHERFPFHGVICDTKMMLLYYIIIAEDAKDAQKKMTLCALCVLYGSN